MVPLDSDIRVQDMARRSCGQRLPRADLELSAPFAATAPVVVLANASVDMGATDRQLDALGFVWKRNTILRARAPVRSAADLAWPRRFAKPLS